MWSKECSSANSHFRWFFCLTIHFTLHHFEHRFEEWIRNRRQDIHKQWLELCFRTSPPLFEHFLPEIRPEVLCGLSSSFRMIILWWMQHIYSFPVPGSTDGIISPYDERSGREFIWQEIRVNRHHGSLSCCLFENWSWSTFSTQQQRDGDFCRRFESFAIGIMLMMLIFGFWSQHKWMRCFNYNVSHRLWYHALSIRMCITWRITTMNGICCRCCSCTNVVISGLIGEKSKYSLRADDFLTKTSRPCCVNRSGWRCASSSVDSLYSELLTDKTSVSCPSLLPRSGSSSLIVWTLVVWWWRLKAVTFNKISLSCRQSSSCCCSCWSWEMWSDGMDFAALRPDQLTYDPM